MRIKFGTDGWRAVIDQEFTTDAVRVVAQAIAYYLTDKGLADRGIIVGYDTRRGSREFAREVSRVMTGNGIQVRLTNRDVPTPVVAYHVIKYGAAGGVMITASHNPPEYNGIKFIPSYGGPAPKDITDDIERRIQEVGEVRLGPEENVELFDPREEYLEYLIREHEFENLRKGKLKIVYDPMHGTGRGYVDEILRKVGASVSTIHYDPDPNFGGLVPEPSDKSLTELTEEVRRIRADLGLATDGDADRFGVVEESGYLHPNYLYPVLMRYFHERERAGVVVRTVSTTHLIDVLAERYGFKVIEVPVGFKYVARAMMEHNAIFGCEESAGMTVRGHVMEKDGILACCLWAEVRSYLGRSFHEEIEDIAEKSERRYFLREDVRVDKERRQKVVSEVVSELLREEVLASKRVSKRITIDGVKLVMEDGSWLLVRPSGTEPLIRVYSEALSEEDCLKLVEHAKELIMRAGA